MATTVNNAFSEFMKNIVNLDADVVSNARSSRDNLLENIAEFDNADGFFNLYQGFNVHYGSFARKTKCRELNDIDLMIGISADGATYNANDPWDNMKITASTINAAQIECARDDGTLNSTQVSNKFKDKLKNVREYSRSEIRRSGEAVILNLKSKDWSFDIVPCFHTVTESEGCAYYLIPNGSGNWKKTDPLKDREHVTNTNREKDGLVLELIRLCKKWNKVKNAKTLPSYLLETMIINHCDEESELSQWIDIRFKNTRVNKTGEDCGQYLLVLFSLLITQLKYEISDEIISPESWFKLKINDYDTVREKMIDKINHVVKTFELNKKFMVKK